MKPAYLAGANSPDGKYGMGSPQINLLTAEVDGERISITEERRALRLL